METLPFTVVLLLLSVGNDMRRGVPAFLCAAVVVMVVVLGIVPVASTARGCHISQVSACCNLAVHRAVTVQHLLEHEQSRRMKLPQQRGKGIFCLVDV